LRPELHSVAPSGLRVHDYRRIRANKYNTADNTTLTKIDVANGK